MDATCTIQDSIHVFCLVHKYVSRILGTYQTDTGSFIIFIYLFYRIAFLLLSDIVRYIFKLLGHQIVDIVSRNFLGI